jgi:hypothetical protein
MAVLGWLGGQFERLGVFGKRAIPSGGSANFMNRVNGLLTILRDHARLDRKGGAIDAWTIF